MYFEYFSCMCTAGTWPVHCVCSSYLVGCVMCGGVAKGSGNVDFFQDNHANPTTTLPAPSQAVPSHCCQELLGGRGTGAGALSQLTSVPCADPWILESSEVSRGAYPLAVSSVLNGCPSPCWLSLGKWVGAALDPCLVVQGNP